ncbi:MAG: hypothetical protein JWM35_943 [Verrucomicrobia bacterium]|nr:hypothetical protein [Verrucomicrobiota bacterium]
MPEPSAWRIDKDKRAASSFDGSGAAKEGGRWNSAGVRVVYCSRTLAMAMTEKYVHLPKPVPTALKFISFEIDFGDLAVDSASKLPSDWAAFPPSASSQKVGDAWVAAGRTAILAVPSAIIPKETNYLLNPQHPDFRKIRISKPEPFVFEDRITRLQEPAR